MGWTNWVSIPSRNKRLFSYQKHLYLLWYPSSLPVSEYQELCLHTQHVATTHLHLQSRDGQGQLYLYLLLADHMRSRMWAHRETSSLLGFDDESVPNITRGPLKQWALVTQWQHHIPINLNHQQHCCYNCKTCISIVDKQ